MPVVRRLARPRAHAVRGRVPCEELSGTRSGDVEVISRIATHRLYRVSTEIMSLRYFSVRMRPDSSLGSATTPSMADSSPRRCVIVRS
jgi:hypothetical protein